VAVNCWVAPTTIEGVAGVTAIEDRVTGGAVRVKIDDPLVKLPASSGLIMVIVLPLMVALEVIEMPTASSVALLRVTEVTVIPLPLKLTLLGTQVPGLKLLPVTVTVPLHPCIWEEGEVELARGPGLTVKFCAALGEELGLVTVTLLTPEIVDGAMLIFTVMEVEEETVVELIAIPVLGLKLMVAPVWKSEPVKVRF
jgi:hypothetical protein